MTSKQRKQEKAIATHIENKEKVRALLRERQTVSYYSPKYKEISEQMEKLDRENIRIEKQQKIYPFDRKRRN